jgi:hypothetical protein
VPGCKAPGHEVDHSVPSKVYLFTYLFIVRLMISDRHGQLTRGSPPAGGRLYVELIPHHKKEFVMKYLCVM